MAEVEIGLVSRIKNGDEKAFEMLFDQYYSGLCLFAYKLIGDLDLSRSIVQEVYINIWLKRERLKINASLKSYLYQAVRNASLDYLKHQKVEESYIAGLTADDYSEEQMNQLREDADINQRIYEAIENLPPQCREVFKLSKIEGFKYAEIAESLNISVKTVEMHMGNALKKLRVQLSDIQLYLFMLFKKLKKL